MRTSRSRRWIWIRIPSSFHSTEDSSKPDIASATSAPVEASIGRIGRKISNPIARSPASPSVIAISRHPREIARQHQRAARELAADAGGLGHRVGHHPGQRALPELAR